MDGISNVPRSVLRDMYLRASYRVYKIDCLLVRGISLPAVQLFVIAIENILRGGVGNLTREKYVSVTWPRPKELSKNTTNSRTENQTENDVS